MRPNVIIADDDPFITQLLSEICDSERMNVRIATNGDEVISMLQEAPPDLILLDIMMPNMNGFQVLEEMRAMPFMKDVAVIVISAVADNDAIRKGYELGASDYFVKPFRVGELLSRLRTHLKAVSFQRLPGQPLDHDLGEQQQLAPELQAMLDKVKHGPLSLLCASLAAMGAGELPDSVQLDLARELRLQVRGVDRLFLISGPRLLFVLPNTHERGAAALNARLGEQLLDALQREDLTDQVQVTWETQTVATGETPTGMAEEFLRPETEDA